MMQN